MGNSWGMNRRNFLKSAGLVALGGAAATLGGCAPKKTSDASDGGAFVENVKWDAEYDVLVVGFGIAGASSAITAAQEGARVLLVEKAPESQAGGNSRVCGQRIATVAPDQRENAIAYCKAMRGSFDTPSDEIIEALVDEFIENESWVETELGQGDWFSIGWVDFPEYEGAGSIVNKCTLGNKGYNSQTYRAAHDRVLEDPNITVWYSSPAIELIQDPSTHIVHGAVVSAEGSEVNVRARNGVILCTGGFESDRELVQNYLMKESMISAGSALHNTGDGVRMSEKAGAKLWHASNYLLDINPVYPGSTVVAFEAQVPFANRGCIFVGPDGTRFTNEAAKPHHGKTRFHGDVLPFQYPLDMYAVFDSAMMGAGKLHAQFSDNNVAEIESGMFVSGETVEELADAISVPAEALQATIAAWNESVKNGADSAFGRDVTGLSPIENGPFYATKMYSSIVSTFGGPERNERGEAIDVDGKVIPHLYINGSLGELWPKAYQGSMCFGGGMAFGRITGREAAAAKDDVPQDALVSSTDEFVLERPTEPEFEIGVNEYLGKGRGMGGTPLYAKVTVGAGKKIEAVEILKHSETSGVIDQTINVIPTRIVEANSTDVDCLTGATTTAKAIVQAVEDALSQA